MKNFNDNLDVLNFHDSYIESTSLSEEGILKVQIHYYNWEGNKSQAQKWATKRLTIEIEHCVHFKFSSPGLIMLDQEIHNHESLEKHSAFMNQLENYKANRKSEFRNTVAVRFLTHSYGESIFGETDGFLEIAGLNARLIWSEV